MESLRIDIINPKALRLLKDLADLDLIRIKEEIIKPDLSELLVRLRNNADSIISLEDITEEVESVRKARYEK